jgi:transcriptional regulator with XRE-family HTH domain
MPLNARRVELGERLRQVRLESALSLQDVATEMRLSKQAIWAWEQGRSGVSALQLASLALIYGASADYLLFGVKKLPEELREIFCKAKR